MTIQYRILSAAVLLGLGSASTSTFSQQVNPYQEQGKLVRAPRALGTLGDNLMGDETNYYNGGLTFSQTDINLPGNNSLPMMITRRFTAGETISTLGHFGHWELDIPHLSGTFSAAQGTGSFTGWVVPVVPDLNINPVARCSFFGAPPDSAAGFGGLGEFSSDEFWHGTHLSVPGQGSQEVLLRSGFDPAHPNATPPADGNNNVPDGPAKYPLVTKNLWAIRCLPSLSSPPARGENGEGFLAVAPDGTQYQFDWLASRGISSLVKSSNSPQSLTAGSGKPIPPTGLSITSPTGSAGDAIVAGIPVPDDEDPNVAASNILPRQEVWIMPTLITDKFGNTLRYIWDTTDKWKLLQMLASDGRTLSFTYVAGTHQIETITDGTRTWRYTYLGGNNGAVLNEVINPDNSRWQLANIEGLAHSISYGAFPPSCYEPGDPGTLPLTGSMTHPSGAVGTFTLQPVLHGRTGIEKDCRIVGYGTRTTTEIAMTPRYFHSNALVQKTLSGPGLPNMTWSMAYGEANAGWSDCTTCTGTKTVIVTDPKGDRTRYIFGNRYNVNDGLLLQTDSGWDGSAALRTVVQSYRSENAGPYAPLVGTSEQTRGDAAMSARNTPVEKRVTTQQGVTFVWQANEFDRKARATVVTRSSSLGMSRTEKTTYQDVTGKFVLGLVQRVVETGSGIVMQANTYDADNGNLLTSSHFGHLDETRTYYPDGTLRTQADGANHTTTFANYKLGLAQNVTYADNSSISATVNDIGLITATTDAAGFTTTYGYDAAGRLNLIRYPAGDNVSWNDTTITTEQYGADEYGIGPNHWKQTTVTGDGREVAYLDAFWRPVLSRTWDNGVGAESATSKMVLRQYDHKGKTTFESYPQRLIGSVNDAVPGVMTAYDALSRPASTLADSEQGKLRTTIEYLSGFQKRVTNARNKSTTSSYQVFDEPSESALTQMTAPEGVNLTIVRDIFGKPTSMTRSGSYGGNPVSNTRKFVYDGFQRLCKTIEPEIGVMKQKWDDANNLLWRASGTTGATLDICGDEYVTAAEKVSYTYDALNRLRTTTYGDGSPGITRTYTLDGLPDTIASNGLTWTTGYNHRRLPVQESLQIDGATYTIGRHYNVNGHLDQLTYPNNLVLDYLPNALGEPTQVGKFASAIAYHPNGAIAGFTYGNGIVRSLGLNARNLPAQAKDAGVLNDLYSYDENANVVGISDQQENISNRSMSYDGLDRMTSANAPNLWGMASYSYDALDNLRTSAVGSRNSTHNYDLGGSNRLLNINSNGVTTSYSYDVLGNITGRGTQGFTFDRGNRMSAATGKASYVYDGLGHRTKILPASGGTRLQIYSQGGQLLYGVESLPGKTPTSTHYIYLHHGMIAEVNQ